MSETWEQTKARLRKQIGLFIPLEPSPDIPKARYDEPVPEPKIPLYEIRKISLPVDPEHLNGKVVVYGVSKVEADWWIENKLKAKSYTDDKTDSKTLVFYEKFLIGAPPKERSIYSNPARFCTEDFPLTPKRIN